VKEKQVVENAQAIGGSVIVQSNGRVTKTAIAIGGNVTLKRGARVDGDAYAVGGQVIQEEGATIGGATESFRDDDRMGMHRGRGSFLARYAFHTSFRIFAAIMGAIVGTILLKMVPPFLPNLAATVRQYPFQSALWGIATIIAVIALNIFLAISLIGIPLIPLLGLLVTLTSFVGGLGVSFFVGQQVMKNEQGTPVRKFLLGLLIITILAVLPFVGGIIVFFVSLFGLGALLAWKLGRMQPPILE
jgi:hypothetical protein